MAKRILAIGVVLLLFSPVAMAQQQSPAPAPQPARQQRRSQAPQRHRNRPPKARAWRTSRKSVLELSRARAA